MPSANRPTVRMRRIGSALRKAREERGMTLDTACRRYDRSKGWLSTLENGLHPVAPQELADLLDFYGVPPGPLRDSLLHLATHVVDRHRGSSHGVCSSTMTMKSQPTRRYSTASSPLHSTRTVPWTSSKG